LRLEAAHAHLNLVLHVLDFRGPAGDRPGLFLEPAHADFHLVFLAFHRRSATFDDASLVLHLRARDLHDGPMQFVRGPWHLAAPAARVEVVRRDGDRVDDFLVDHCRHRDHDRHFPFFFHHAPHLPHHFALLPFHHRHVDRDLVFFVDETAHLPHHGTPLATEDGDLDLDFFGHHGAAGHRVRHQLFLEAGGRHGGDA
jgi:hypothetical protein